MNHPVFVVREWLIVIIGVVNNMAFKRWRLQTRANKTIRFDT